MRGHALDSVRRLGAHLRRPGARQKNFYLMLRSHHRPDPPAGSDRAQGNSEDPALGRSREGLSTKIHLLTDENGLPVAFRITASHAAEYAESDRAPGGSIHSSRVRLDRLHLYVDTAKGCYEF